MTAKHHPESDTAFFRAKRGLGHYAKRTWTGGKRHAVSIGVSAIITGLASTFIPMLENHWAAQDERDAIAAAVAPVQRQLDELKQDFHNANQAQWNAINRKRDR